MGINARRSLDPRWVDHHTRTIDGFKNCTVQITRRNLNVPIEYDPDTKEYTNAYTVVYTGQARIQPYGINLDLEVANDPTARRLVLVQITGKNLGIETDDMLTVTAAENNTDLMLYKYDVRGSLGSSMEWGTNLVTEANLKISADVPINDGYGYGGYGE